jgi:hypothetical protein
MPIEIRTGTNEERVIRLLMARYPVTDRDVSKELGIRLEVVQRILKALATQGIVSLEPLEDKTYVRLLRRDFHFVGRSPTQKRALKHTTGKKRKGGKKPLRRRGEDPDDFSYM